VVSDDPVSDGQPRAGFISKTKIKEGSKIVEYESEIATYQPTSHLGLILRGGSLGKGPMHVDYRLSAEGDGTVLNFESRWKPHGILLKLMTPLLTKMSRKNIDADMHRLKAFAESQNKNR
ncbi:MAG: hypothetical protein GY943_22210, partial [Chloroflexi bacterium]|nr:hypothetical protein [Chloroflexota bacterium]